MSLGQGGLAAGPRLLPGRPPLVLGVLAAILVFLAVLALATAVAADRAARSWGVAVADSATLSIIAEEAELEAQARTALAILSDTPGVRKVRVMEPAEQRALLAPFLGTGIAFDAATLPLMITVETDRRMLDAVMLDSRLAAEAPGAVFDDHSAWRLPLAAAAARQRDLAIAAAALLVIAIAAAAVLAVRVVAAAAGGALRTLREIGMPDAGLRHLLLARVGGMLVGGAALGAVAGVVVAGSLDPDRTATGFGIGFSGWSWTLPPLVAGLAVLVALAAGWLVAGRALRAWP